VVLALRVCTCDLVVALGLSASVVEITIAKRLFRPPPLLSEMDTLIGKLAGALKTRKLLILRNGEREKNRKNAKPRYTRSTRGHNGGRACKPDCPGCLVPPVTCVESMNANCQRCQLCQQGSLCVTVMAQCSEGEKAAQT